MTPSEFQRARRPEQKRERERAILDAAAAIVEAEGVERVTLTAIAKRAGLAKSNLYRYFESREDILLQLLSSDEAEWVTRLERALAPHAGSGDVEAAGAAIAGSLADSPRLCQLISVLTVVLEQNITIEVARSFKDRVAEQSIRISNAVHAALPGVAIDRLDQVQRLMHALIAGLWPIAHPAPVIVELHADPSYAHFASDFEADLRAGIVALLHSLARDPV